MTNSFRLLVSTGTLGLALAGCGDGGVDGNGNRVDESRDVAAFTRVRSDCDLDVQVVMGDTQSLTISLDSNLQELVRTRVDGDTLYVETTENVEDTVDGPHILITVPELTAAKLDGSGSMTLAFDEPELPLDLYLSGSGDLSFSGTTAVVGAYLSGSGDLRLEGKTSDVDMKLSGSGSIHGKKLTASSAAIVLSGSGSVSANAQDSVTVSLSGSGSVDLFGDATLADYHNTGSGDIVQH
jgi:hypothetical protein